MLDKKFAQYFYSSKSIFKKKYKKDLIRVNIMHIY